MTTSQRIARLLVLLHRALDPLEQVGAASHLKQQDLCFPISTAERQTNPKLGG